MQLNLTLDRRSRVPLALQIGRGIVDLARCGVLLSDIALPSSRILARQLRVSRMTVVSAYEWLTSEGYAESRRGSGTYVSDALARMKVSPSRLREAPAASQTGPAPGATIVVADLRAGLPALADIPRRELQRHYSAAIRAVSVADLGYGDVLGGKALRSEVARYLLRARGLSVEPGRVILTSGAAQAFDLVLRALPDRREIVVEEPGPAPLRMLPDIYGCRLLNVPVDSAGLRVDLLPDTAAPRMVYVIPSHQFPTGAAMSLDRKAALLDWSRRTGALVVEDDYDSELMLDGLPSLPIARLDERQETIYLGTFSKTLFPAMRLGFAVLPEWLVEPVRQICLWAGRGPPIIEQEAMMRYLASGQHERHIQRMRRHYASRLLALQTSLQIHLIQRFRILGKSIGLHIAVAVRTRVPVQGIRDDLARAGILLSPAEGDWHLLEPDEIPIIIGFGNASASELDKAIMFLAELALSRR